MAHRQYGRLPWAKLVAPAADLAESGFPTFPYLYYLLSAPFIFNRTLSNPLMREAFLIQDKVDGSWRLPAVGELCCRRPKLARTLRGIAKKGSAYLYTDEMAQVMAKEIQAAGGESSQPPPTP